MDASPHGISPLRQRMIDDMRMRKLSPKTQSAYIRIVRQFTGFLGRLPDTAMVEDLRRYQLHLVDHGVSPVSLNAAITGLKFFFEVTLDQGDLMAKMQPVQVPHTLPVVLSRDEAARLIAAARNLKHQTALSVAYGTGLRASEVVALKTSSCAASCCMFCPVAFTAFATTDCSPMPDAGSISPAPANCYMSSLPRPNRSRLRRL
jgi:integrase/recombinase XerD